MPKLILQIVLALALTLGAAVFLASEVWAGGIVVDSAYARASATPTASAGTVYLRLVGGDQADRLVAVASPAAGTAMLHESRTVDGIARMQPIAAIEIPAGSTVDLAPGGSHIMLMGLKAPLKKGDTLVLTLTFAKAGEVDVRVPVGAVAQVGPPSE